MTTHDVDLAQVDPTGAFTETLHDAGEAGLTRGGALRAALAGLGGSALASGLLVPSADAATKISRKNDVKILQFALVAEYLGRDLYAEALKKGKLSGATKSYAKQAHKDEAAHVIAVSKQIRKLGGTPIKPPTFDFGKATSDPTKFRSTAAAVEQVCVEALNGAGPLVTTSTLAAAGQLVSVEARQVTWIRLIIAGTANPVPSSFDGALTLAQAAKKVRATHFVTDTLHKQAINAYAKG